MISTNSSLKVSKPAFCFGLATLVLSFKNFSSNNLNWRFTLNLLHPTPKPSDSKVLNLFHANLVQSFQSFFS